MRTSAFFAGCVLPTISISIQSARPLDTFSPRTLGKLVSPKLVYTRVVRKNIALSTPCRHREEKRTLPPNSGGSGTNKNRTSNVARRLGATTLQPTYWSLCMEDVITRPPPECRMNIRAYVVAMWHSQRCANTESTHTNTCLEKLITFEVSLGIVPPLSWWRCVPSVTPFLGDMALALSLSSLVRALFHRAGSRARARWHPKSVSQGPTTDAQTARDPRGGAPASPVAVS